MVVEYVRSSYSGHWRLWDGRPDLLVGGRYVECPPDTPHFPYIHRMGSASWLPNDAVPDPLLGPADLPRRGTWFGGATPDPYPATSPVGDPRNIADGARYPRDVAPIVIDGYPAPCWEVATQVVPLWRQRLPDYQDRLTQVRLASLIEAAYADPDSAVQLALDYGAVTSTRVGGPSDWMPLTFYADFGTWQLFYSAGSNTDQLALQAFSSFLGPTNYGGMNVLLLHGQAAQITLDRMTALGYDPARPVLLTGHSYGGAIASIAATRIYEGPGDAVVRLVTFGSPKIGDEATARRVGQVPAVHLVTRGDPVADLPPSVGITTPLGIVPFPGFEAWAEFKPVPVNRVILEADGARTYSQEEATGWADYSSAIGEAILGDPITLPITHSITTYLDRLKAGG